MAGDSSPGSEPPPGPGNGRDSRPLASAGVGTTRGASDAPPLALLATPIGNLGDLSARALETLRQADLVACEDTRRTGLLLHRLEIKKALLSLHAHSEASRCQRIVDAVRQGQRVVLVSDAGMPGIADPGERLVQAAIEAGLTVEVIPGPSAVPVALAGSGLPATPFYFGGFLPPKSGGRSRELEAALARDHTSVFFEAPHRLLRTLQRLAELAPDRRVVVARELTKKFEEFVRGRPPELIGHFEQRPPKGEITLMVAGESVPKWVRW